MTSHTNFSGNEQFLRKKIDKICLYFHVGLSDDMFYTGQNEIKMKFTKETVSVYPNTKFYLNSLKLFRK